MKNHLTILLALVLLLPTTAGASDWGGHHGTIHLSFTPPPDLQPVSRGESMGEMGTVVEVFAVLKDLDPIKHEGERILAAGGYELRLRIEGADDARVLTKEIPTPHFDVSKDPAAVICGLQPDITFTAQGVVLVVWKVLIPGAPHPVSFHLDPAGVRSLTGIESAAESGSYAIWSGSLQNRQHGLLFSAGYVPAYLNADGDVDLTERLGTGHWSDRGMFTVDE